MFAVVAVTVGAPGVNFMIRFDESIPNENAAVPGEINGNVVSCGNCIAAATLTR